MAISKCPKCDNASFEVVENSPLHSNYKLIFVQCRKCGSVVGTMDYSNIGTILKDVEKKVGFGTESSTVNKNLDVVNQNVIRLFNLIENSNRRLDEIEEKLSKNN